MSASDAHVSRRQVLAAGTAFTGYALAADTVLAQAIETDTTGLAPRTAGSAAPPGSSSI